MNIRREKMDLIREFDEDGQEWIGGYRVTKECPMKGRMCQCSDKENCIHQGNLEMGNKVKEDNGK
jgi:hypothetical protein